MVEPEELREALEKRLPALLEEFRSDMEGIGMGWEVPVERRPGPKF